MIEFRIDDRPMRQAAKAMKDADKKVRKQFAEAAQRSARKVEGEVRKSALRTFPSGGGLNEWVAALTITIRVSMTGDKPSVFVTGALDNKRVTQKTSSGKRRSTRRAGTFGAQGDLRALNRGRIMHPAWGRGPLVGPQLVKPGFWDNPLKGPVAEQARKEIMEAMKTALRQIAADAE